MGERRTIEIAYECVESMVTEDGLRAKLAIPTRDDLPPVVTELRVPAVSLEELDVTPEGTQAAIADICDEAAEHALLAAAGRGMVADRSTAPPDTLRDLGTAPRVSHEDRARILAELIRDKSALMVQLHGEGWLERMIASEFRAVYTDGENKGAKARPQ